MTPDEERLITTKAMLTACEASITKLLGKTNQSVSFGDQSYTSANISELLKVRNQLLQEVRALESRIAGGTRRRSIKIYFPSC